MLMEDPLVFPAERTELVLLKDLPSAPFSSLKTAFDSPYQALDNETVLVSTVFGNVRVLAPVNPIQDMKFRVKKLSVDDRLVLIDAGTGETIELAQNIRSNGPTAILVGGSGAIAEWQYRDSSAVWICTAASKVVALNESWSATPITSVAPNPSGSTIVWTFEPFFVGQTPVIATHSAGTFTYQSDGAFNISLDIIVNFLPTTNNTEAQMRLVDNFTPITQNEIQTIAITGTPTAGSFTLTFVGETTAPIAFDATAAVVDAALEALSLIDPGDVTCTGGPLPGTDVACEFTGGLANTNVPQMVPDSTLLTGGTASVVTTQEGNDGTGVETVLDMISAFQSSRGPATFAFSKNTRGRSMPNPGDTTLFTIGTDFFTGMTVDLKGGLLVFDTG